MYISMWHVQTLHFKFAQFFSLTHSLLFVIQLFYYFAFLIYFMRKTRDDVENEVPLIAICLFCILLCALNNESRHKGKNTIYRKKRFKKYHYLLYVKYFVQYRMLSIRTNWSYKLLFEWFSHYFWRFFLNSKLKFVCIHIMLRLEKRLFWESSKLLELRISSNDSKKFSNK